MNVVAIVQARMGSTRLPGKVLLNLCGQTVLGRVVSQVQGMRNLDGFVVAIPLGPADDSLNNLCRSQGWPVFRGDGEDVLDRYYQAAKALDAQHIVRITADCPLVCVAETDRLIADHLHSHVDFSHNITAWGSGLPLGTSAEVFTWKALEMSWRDGQAPHHREHVDEYINDNPEKFSVARLLAPPELRWPELRLTVDDAADLDLMRKIYARLDRTCGAIDLQDVIRVVREELYLLQTNQHAQQRII